METEKFSIDVIGEETGKTWKGLFKMRIRLGHKAQLRMDEIRRDLLGAKPELASPRAHNQSEIFSTVWSYLVEAPEWWNMNENGISLEDDSPVAAVYDKILAIRLEVLKKRKDTDEAAKAELAKLAEPK